ncbi:hypothetical protein E4U53_002674 [Claviceps sorghi]|nr:hypothetical protein E4U53_002674 [Claviceps sorghi]
MESKLIDLGCVGQVSDRRQMRRMRGSGGGSGSSDVGVVVGGAAAAAAVAAAVAVGVGVGVGAVGRLRPFVLAPRLTHSCRSFYKTRVQTVRIPQLAPPPAQHPAAPRPQQQQPARLPTTSRLPSVLASRRPLRPLRPNHRRFSSTTTMSELKWPSARVRKAFFDYMEQRGHTIGMDVCPLLAHPIPSHPIPSHPMPHATYAQGT